VHTHFVFGISMGILAGLVNGIYLIPMRYVRRWAWENTWLVFTVLSTFVFPWVAGFVTLPSLMSVFRASPWSYLLPGVIAGLVWGIAQVMYGLACGMVGIAIGSTVISCAAVISGTLGPIFVYAPGKFFGPSGLALCLALALIVAGIYFYGKAGVGREKETRTKKGAPVQIVQGAMRTGLTICLICGVLGTVFVYGGKSSTSLLAASAAAGASPLVAIYLTYIVIFNAGTIPGLIYTLYRLARNRTFPNYASAGAVLPNLILVTIMALLWYAGLLLYAAASQEMGRLGPSIAFALFSSDSILFANLSGWLAGEWRGSSRATIQRALKGMALIVAAVLIVAFGVRSPG
jgi:L-rhamnose-H+ transport protein